MEKIKGSPFVCFGIITAILLIKSIVFGFMVASQGNNLARFIDIKVILGYIGFIAIILVPMFFIKGKGQLIYLITIDIIYSLYLVLQIRYFIETGYFAGLSTFALSYMYEPLENISLKFLITDVLWFIDNILLIFGVIFLGKRKFNLERSIKSGIGVIVVSLIAIIGTHMVVDRNLEPDDVGFMKVSYHPVITIKSMSPIGYLFYDTKMVIEAKINKEDAQEEKRINEWMTWNKESLPDNKYKGLLKNKNVIFIQVESLENIVINQKAENQEITPNMNRLASEGIYFSNIYEQNNGGNTADCDFMSNTSIFPLSDEIAFLSHSYKQYNSLPKILENKGYETIAGHAEDRSDFYWKQNYYSLGFNNIYDKSDLALEKMVGAYHSDEEFLDKYSDKLKNIKQPFYSMSTTITSHGPFDLPDEAKYLNLSEELNSNRLGEYFQAIHYTDRQIGMFVDKLDKMGILKDSMIVIFGDHCGPHKYYPDLIKDAPIKEDWWREDKKQVPFIIYSPDMESAVIDKNGGQVDIMPTVLYLLGIDNDQMMGRNLLNTNRNATIYVNNRNKERNVTIAGTPENNDEKNKLEEAYQISNIIIDK